VNGSTFPGHLKMTVPRAPFYRWQYCLSGDGFHFPVRDAPLAALPQSEKRLSPLGPFGRLKPIQKNAAGLSSARFSLHPFSSPGGWH
jgi:hypothetical protein